MNTRLNTTGELERYLDQIKILEKQIEDIESRKQIDLRGQSRRVNSPVKGRDKDELRSRNEMEASRRTLDDTNYQETLRKTVLHKGNTVVRSRSDQDGRQTRRSMELFEDVELHDLDRESNACDDREVNMSQPYGDLVTEERSDSMSYEPRVIRTKEILRKKGDTEVNDIHDYIREKQHCLQREERRRSEMKRKEDLTRTADPRCDEYDGLMKNKSDVTTRCQRYEQPVANQIRMGYDTASNCKPYYIKPPRFDGKGCIEAHITQFNIAANRNKWTEEEKVDFMKISLSGEASNILKDIKEDISFEELTHRLKSRYGSLDQVEAYRVQLKSRRRKRGESLSDLMKDIRRLFTLAYTGPSNYLSDLTAKDAFVDALDDRELMIRVMEREPKNLEEAFKIAERMELYSKRVENTKRNEPEGKQKNKIRVAAVGDASHEMDMLVESQKAMQQQINTLVQMMQQQCRRNESSTKESTQSGVEGGSHQKIHNKDESNKRPTFNCFQCGQEGHMKSRCPENRNNRNRFYRNSTAKEANEANE